MPKVIIVDEKDNIIGSKERKSMKKSDFYRVSALWITNSKGEILLARRSRNKTHSPGKWGPAVAGTIEENETYDSNIKKETEEEIGLKGAEFEKRNKVKMKTDYNYFCQWYFLKIDKDTNEFKIQKSEVEEVKWFSKADLLRELKNNPDEFLLAVKEALEMFN